jgi:hypothetical protein
MRRTKHKTDSTTRFKQRLERMSKKMYQAPTPNIIGQGYYYVYGWTLKGRPVFWGPFFYPHEADASIASLAQGEAFQYPTRVLSEATRLLKAELIKRGIDPDEALNRISHKRE